MKRNIILLAALAALLIIIGMAYYAFGVAGGHTPEPAGAGSSEPEAWGLSGIVYDQNKVAIPGATVTIYKATRDNATGGYVNVGKLNIKDNPQISSNGSLGAPGSFMFTAVPRGQYNITAEIEGRTWYAIVESWPSPDYLNISIPDYAYIQPASTPTPGSLKPAPAQGPWATVYGTVRDDNGSPVSNATVTLWAVGTDKNGNEMNLGKAIVASADPRSNASDSANPQLSSDGSHSAPGMYSFYKVPWGKYNVTAEKDGKLWSATFIAGQGGQFGTAKCDVGGPLPGAPQWATLSGIVTDQNKVGIPGAIVTLWNVRWDNASGTYVNTKLAGGITDNPILSDNGTTGAVGMYTFYRVPWNVYNVTAEKDGHLWYSVLLLGPWPEDNEAYKNASFRPGSEFGTAVHNIAIPDYSYTYGQQSAPTGHPEASNAVRAGAGQEVLTSGGGTILGMVVDGEGAVVPNATVTLWYSDLSGNLGTANVANNSQLTGDGYDSALGSFRFDHVPAGTYNVTAEKDGMLWSSLFTMDSDFHNRGCTITAGRGEGVKWGIVTGITMDLNGTGIGGVKVSLWNGNVNASGKFINEGLAGVKDNPQYSNGGSTAATGLYRFYQVPWGSYNLTAEKNGTAWSHIVTLGPGADAGTVTHDFHVKP